MLVINDDNYKKFIDGQGARVNGQMMSRGLVPRNLTTQPVGYLSAAPAWSKDVPTIPKSEWSDIIKFNTETKSRLIDIRNIGDNGRPIKSLDQNGQGYCWAYGTVGAQTILRAKSNLPYRRLSAHAVACKIKNFRDEGGWGALSLDYIAKYGTPTVEYWKEKSMSRQYDTEETWRDASLRKITEGWVDLNAAVYDRDLSFEQMMTLLLMKIPVVCDFNWWGHCVVALDAVEIERGSFGPLIWNSWTDGWGDNGTGVLQGSKGIPDNAVAPRAITVG